jgi:hypothetical protein
MAAPQLPPQPTGKSLFSQHYLATRLPEQPEWQDDSVVPLTALSTLWQKAQRYGANWNEAQTEDEFIGWRIDATVSLQPHQYEFMPGTNDHNR